MSLGLPANLIFMTGTTGFIGSRLAVQILTDRPQAEILTIVPKGDLKKLWNLQETLAKKQLLDRFHWIVGDITKIRLGLDAQTYFSIQQKIQEVFHLAAFYRLDASTEAAWRVNYLGTREVVQLAKRCPRLTKFHHFSSLVADGMCVNPDASSSTPTPVPFIPRPFLNDYERSKYLTEVLIREELRAVPTVNIFRPGIVIGDASTGITDKFDGVYFFLIFLRRYRTFLKWVPLFLQARDVRLPVVPVDYVVEAANFIAKSDQPGVHVIPIVQNPPIHWRSLYAQFFEKIVGKKPRLAFNIIWLKRLVSLPLAKKLLGFPETVIAYLNYEIPVNTSVTQAKLENSGIICPDFTVYWEKIVDFFLAHEFEMEKYAPPKEPMSWAFEENEEEIYFPFAEKAGFNPPLSRAKIP